MSHELMMALVYPATGYISENLVQHLQKSGQEVLQWSDQALHKATAVFHILHGHEAHARTTVLQLLQQQQQSSSARPSVTFVGISTPLTWAATPVKAAAQQLSSTTAGASQQQSQQLEPQAGQTTEVGAAAAATAAAFTAKDAPSRRPAAAALQTYHVEQLILRCNRPVPSARPVAPAAAAPPAGRLAAFVVCPGVLYGAGEDDSQLHLLFKAAWEGRSLPLLGTGSNRLPTLHVRDLAAFAEAVVLQSQQQQQQQQQQRIPSSSSGGRYLLAADESAVTQAQLVAALGQLLGSHQTQSWTAADCLLAPPPSPTLLLDLPMISSSLSLQQQGSAPWLRPHCPGGLLMHLRAVLGELVAARGLTSLRILIRGAPASGKTHVGRRLAAAYGLMHINPASLLAELRLMDPDTQKAAAALLSSKEGRLSNQLMARLAQHLLARSPAAAHQGWVLEGWPKTLAAARLLTAAAVPQGSLVAGALRGGSGEGAAAGRRESIAGAAAGGKEKKKSGGGSSSPGSGCSEGGAGGRARRTTALADEDTAVEGAAQCQAPELLPHFCINLEVPEEELLRRVKALAAAEAAAVAAATAAATAAAAAAAAGPVKQGATAVVAGAAAAAAKKPGSAGRKEAGAASAGLPGSHNNEKDWGRRMEVYRQVLAEDAADLAARRLAAMAADAAAAISQQLLASGSPVDTHGRSARSTASASRGPSAASANSADCAPAPGPLDSTDDDACGGVAAEVANPDPGSAAPAAAASPASASTVSDVKLPEHGGFVAHFVDAGAAIVRPITGRPVGADGTAAIAACRIVDAQFMCRILIAGARYISISNTRDEAAAAAAADSLSIVISHTQQQQQGQQQHAAVLVPLPLVEQQLRELIGPPHNHAGFPSRSGNSSCCPAAMHEAAVISSTAAKAGSAAGGAVGSAPPSPQQQNVDEVATPAAGAVTSGSDAAGHLSSSDGQKPHDLTHYQAVAEELLLEHQQRAQASCAAACRPLVAALMSGVMPALMAGLTQVAVSRPAEPHQVVARELLAAAAALEADWREPYDSPAYAVQLAKVAAKAVRDAARTDAAAAKTARDEAAARQAAEEAAAAPAASPGAGPDMPAGCAVAGTSNDSKVPAATPRAHRPSAPGGGATNVAFV